MSAERKPDLHLEVAHVLFMDVVGYSKLLVNEQREVVEQLNQFVRKSPQFRKSESAGKLIRIPVGDGMALVFFQTPEEPVQCAMEIARALKNHPRLRLRMGVHSGPVDQVKDVNDRLNVAGTGINIAQRVMDCGDAGHILLSKRVAEDLAQDSHWQPHLHEIGEVELKHGAKLGIVNLYTEELGNPEPPEKVEVRKRKQGASVTRPKVSPIFRLKYSSGAAAILLMAALGIGFWKSHHLAAPKLTSTSTAVPEKSIAVLPFENLSANQENAFFTDGVQDEILADLAKVADLKVISRTSVMLYKSGNPRNLREIGQQLGVAHVLEGSVQRAANRVRVMAQLIDARNDAHLWAQTYDRDLADVFAIQSEIAKTIADQLQTKLSSTEKIAINERSTSDLPAYDLYLRAKELLYAALIDNSRLKDSAPKAVQLLNEALARDPAFLLAHCQLAYAHDIIYFSDQDHTEARLALADKSVKAALRLGPDSGEAHLALARHLYWGQRDYDAARAELAIAGRTLPNNAEIYFFLGAIERRQGHLDEAIRDLERAVDLDPRNGNTISTLGGIYLGQRKYGEAIATYNRMEVLELRPVWLPGAREWIGVEAQADMAPLRTVLNKIEAEGLSSATAISGESLQLALRERDPAKAARALAIFPGGSIGPDPFSFPKAWYEGLLAKLRQDAPAANAAFMAARAETEKLVRAQPGDAKPLSMLALIDAELGEKEKAIHEGRTSCDMLPPSKDAIDGVYLLTNLALIYALTGEKDLALEELDVVSRIPFGPSYGQLRLDAEWDALRGDRRFEKIVASLAPKPVAK